MNILIISNLFPNKYFPSNGVFIIEQCKALIKLGCKVTVIAPTPFVFPGLQYFSKKWQKYKKINESEIYSNIQVYRPRFLAIPNGILKQYWYFFLFQSSKKIVSKLKEEIDLIHIQSSAPDDYAGYLLSKKYKIPYLITIHGEAVIELPKVKNRFNKTRIVIEKADGVIAVSSKIERIIYEITRRKQNIEVILNGYKSNNEVEIIKKEEVSDIKLLYAGNLIKRKGVKYLIKAFYELNLNKNVKLYIVGDGEEEKKLKLLSDKLNLSDSVIFLGRLGHKQLMDLMTNIDIFVMPSWDEAFGVVYLEAMSKSKPIIGTIAEGIEDIVENGVNGLLVKSRNIADLKDRLLFLIKNKEEREKMGKNGKKSIRKLTWEFNAEQTIKYYKKILKDVKNG